MRVLLDECVPKQLRRHLRGVAALTVTQAGWSGKSNGVLLALMRANHFDVLVTTDQNLSYQQDISGSGVALIVVKPVSQDWRDLVELAPRILEALQSIEPGQVVRLEA